MMKLGFRLIAYETRMTLERFVNHTSRKADGWQPSNLVADLVVQMIRTENVRHTVYGNVIISSSRHCQSKWSKRRRNQWMNSGMKDQTKKRVYGTKAREEREVLVCWGASSCED